MQIRKILNIENDGINIAICDNYMYIRCKREILKYNIYNMSLLSQNTIFKKDGKARGFTVDDTYIYLFDFCDVYILHKDNLQVIESARIGTDLSSDVGGIRLDKNNAYISIRNGIIAVTDKKTIDVRFYEISDSSFWDYLMFNQFIYAGSVKGELIEIDKNNMSVNRKKAIHKKNIYSLVILNK